MKKTLIALALSGLAVSAFANNNNLDNGLYLGMQAGLAKTGLSSDNNYHNDIVVDFKNEFFAGRIFGGYNFNKYFSAEVGFLATTNATAHLVYNDMKFADLKLNQQIADLTGKARFYMGDRFYAYGKGGITYDVARIKLKNSNEEAKDSRFGFLLGGGIGYDFSRNLSADVSYTVYSGKKDGAKDMISGEWQPNTRFLAVGLSYKF